MTIQPVFYIEARVVGIAGCYGIVCPLLIVPFCIYQLTQEGLPLAEAIQVQNLQHIHQWCAETNVGRLPCMWLLLRCAQGHFYCLFLSVTQPEKNKRYWIWGGSGEKRPGIGRGMVLSLINQVMALPMIQYTWHRVYCNLTLLTKSSFMIHLDISRVYWCCKVLKLMNDSLSQHNGDGFGNAIKLGFTSGFYSEASLV